MWFLKSDEEHTIPPLKSSVYSIDELGPKHLEFYNRFEKETDIGNYIDLGEWKGYCKVYISRVNERFAQPDNLQIDKSIWLLKQFQKLHGKFAESMIQLCKLYLIKGEFEIIVEEYYNEESELQIDSNLLKNLKLKLGIPLKAKETLAINNLTPVVQNHVKEITEIADEIIEKDRTESGVDYLVYISNKNPEEGNYMLWNSYDYRKVLDDILKTKKMNSSSFCFFALDEFEDYCNSVSRRAENILREKMELPKVGEGWVSETQLFNSIKESFKQFDVLNHASPEWLGRQHLDVFIPSLKLAFEYQGIQHDKPVDFFGGEESFIETQKRDVRKERLCKENNVKLIEVREGYDFKEVIDNISTRISELNKNEDG